MKREMKEDMEQKELNLCEILKGHEDKVFYSPIWGDTLVTYIYTNENYLNIVPISNHHATPIIIYGDGKANAGGKPMLYPTEIAFDNDDFEASWQAWVKENNKVTYEDIEKCLAKQFWCGIENINCTSKKQLDKLHAINKLMNVQKWIEKGWQPDWKNRDMAKWYIFIEDDMLIAEESNWLCGDIYFSSKVNAEKAIEILGEDVIRQALSTDW